MIRLNASAQRGFTADPVVWLMIGDMLDPHRLAVFRSVVASGSVQAAADNLGLTSSAVSQHLAALQRETGLPSSSAPAAASSRPRPRCAWTSSDEAMSQWGRLEQVVTDLRDGRSGRLSIGYFASAGSAWMPTLARRLTSGVPGPRPRAAAQRGRAAWSAPRPRPRHRAAGHAAAAGLRRVDLTEDPFVAVLPRDHALAGAAEVALTDLRGETWVSNDYPGAVGHRIVVAACAAVGCARGSRCRPRTTTRRSGSSPRASGSR